MGQWFQMLVNKTAELAGGSWIHVKRRLLSVISSVDTSLTPQDLKPRLEIGTASLRPFAFRCECEATMAVGPFVMPVSSCA